MDLGRVDTILKGASHKKTQLIGILQDVQREFGYLPFKALARIADTLEISLQQIYNVATFYKAFTLKPQGKHLIAVCLGTACHVRGAERIMEKLERDLEIEDETGNSPDMKFSIEPVRCIGCCSLGPVIRIDDDTHGRLKLDRLTKITDQYE